MNRTKSLKQQHAIMGQYAEELAIGFMLQQGLTLLHHQYRTKTGEVDLILLDKQTSEIVFLEVRYREKNNPIDPLETIDKYKQRKIIRASQHYLQYREWTDAYGKRFDVISVLGDKLNPKITWISDAFGVE